MPKQVAPIKPNEVAGRQNSAIPPVVIEVFNELIVKDFKGGSAQVYQEDVVKHLVAKGLKREEIYKNNWLDVEDLFRKNGWSVEYDKPAYNEFYAAFFIFSAK